MHKMINKNWPDWFAFGPVQKMIEGLLVLHTLKLECWAELV